MQQTIINREKAGHDGVGGFKTGWSEKASLGRWHVNKDMAEVRRELGGRGQNERTGE